LLLRTASIFTGSIPVTINWQADTIDKILFKLNSTGSRIIFVDDNTSKKDVEVFSIRPYIIIYNIVHIFLKKAKLKLSGNISAVSTC
jgi:hypothetical protein